MPSVTISNLSLQNDGPILEVHFCIPQQLEQQYVAQGTPIPAPVIVKSLIDTGCFSCIIQDGIPQKLGLVPIGSTTITTPSSQAHNYYAYFMRMIIPTHNNLSYEGVFIAAPLQGQNIECLMGRDLLANGILIYLGNANQFTPSLL